MSGNIKAVEVDGSEARGWLERSLAQGFDLSGAALAAAPFDHGRFVTFLPSNIPAEQVNFAEGGKVRSEVADSGLAQFFDGIVRSEDCCLIVEDDVARQADPKLDHMTVPSAFLGDRVVHWLDLKPGFGTAAVEATREGAFGYPLNAFAVARSAAALGLVDRHPVAEDFAKLVVAALQAVVVSAFDAESFLVWEGA